MTLQRSNVRLKPANRHTADAHSAFQIRELGVDQLSDLAERLGGQPIPGLKMTESGFADWCPDELRAEWIDGRVILMSPSNVEHDDLSIWFIRLIGDFVEEHQLGTIYRNIFVRLPGQRRRRVPDLMFVSAGRLNLLQPTYLGGAPDLLIEIVSPDSQSRDRREKFIEYEKAGVREFWIVDPLSKTLEVYKLDKRKFIRLEETKGVIASSVLRGFKLKSAHLWSKPLPKVSIVLRAMKRA